MKINNYNYPNMQIEDPFEQPDNTARAVTPHNLRTITRAFHVTHQLLSSSSVLCDRNSLLQILSRPIVSLQLCAPIYTHQQANLRQYRNMNGNQQGDERVGYCVSAFAEPSLSQDRTTRVRTTGKVYADPNQLTQLATGSSLSKKSNHSDYRIGISDLNHLSQQANTSNPSKSKLGEKLVEYCVPSFQVARDSHDSMPNHNNRNHQVHYSAQHLNRASQDYVVNLNESHRTRSTIVEPKHDNWARNQRNIRIRFAGQTPERFDGRQDPGSRGVCKTGMTSGKPTNDPSLIRSHQSHPLVMYSTTPPGSIAQTCDAGTKGTNRMHRSGLAIAEPITEQLSHSLKLNGQSYGSRSQKGKQIWQQKVGSNQVLL